MSLSGSEKASALRAALASGTVWYAACESGHPFWSGPDRSTYADADADAKAHDNATHGGEPTAVVLNS